jgi:RNA methyltransferase, TrmH family
MKLLPATPEILKRFSGLKESDSGRDYFIADSARVVLNLLETPIEIVCVLATKDWIETHKEKLTKAKVPTAYCSTLEEMESIVGMSLHQGIMALAVRPKDCELGELVNKPILVIDGVSKTDNVGAIVRNAAAFGIHNLLIDSRTVHPYHRRAVRTSMGNVYHMKIHQTSNLPSALNELKKLGVKVYGFENRPSAINLHDASFSGKVAVVIGSEATGISQEVTETCDQLVRIPILQEVYALNASCASAVALYELSQKMKTV